MTVAPAWDLTSFFPSVGSRELTAAHERLGADVGRLQALYDARDVRGGAGQVDVDAFEEVLAATNDVLEQVRLVATFVNVTVWADASDDAAQAVLSQLRAVLAPLPPLTARFDAWVASIGADALAAESDIAADHTFRLHKAEVSAQHQMSESEEALAAELHITGGSAWAQLWGDVTSRLTARVGGEDLPMTVVRGLAMDPSSAVRREAYEAELKAWAQPLVATSLAACMNGVKGETVALNRRRGWADALAPSLHANSVDRGTLAAMHSACTASLPVLRRYLRTKAAMLGHAGGLPWWDLFAPVATAATPFTWDAACEEVVAAFGSFSGPLRSLAERAIAERWVDAEPRPGKRGGAFCAGLRGDESRILMTFSDSFDSVSTLAHELGHAYHNVTLAERSAMQRQLPMALAETASIFCETILVQSGLTRAAADGDRARQLVLLDNDLAGAAQVVVDIWSRFLFETEVFDRRADRALSVSELCAAMVDSQLEAYGDGLAADALHPYMWAVKPHYYSSTFYNWPYTFGLLFGIGLYAAFVEDPDRFRQGYDDLLSLVGMGDAATLAATFGIDVRDESFWVSSLDVLGARVDQFCELAAG